MRLIYKLLLILMAFVACEKELPVENGVTVLSDNNFDEFIEKNEFVLLMFTVPDCGHCMQFQPVLEKSSSGLKLNNIVTAKIDGMENKKTSKKFHITDYPRVKFFAKGREETDYNGGKTVDDIIHWCVKHKEPAYPILSSKQEIEKLKNEHNTTIIYFGTEYWDVKYFTRLAYYHEKFQFGQVTDEKLAKEYNTEMGHLIMFKNYDDKRADYKQKFEYYTVNRWIILNYLPKVKDFKDNIVYQLVFGNDRQSAMILFTNEKDEKKLENYKKMLYEVNMKIKGKIFTVISDLKSGNGRRAGEYVGIKESDLPQVRIINTTEAYVKYAMTDEINVENIVKFYNDYEQGKLKLFYKSQDIPKDNTGDVFILVRDNFKKEVLQNDKDVFVLFYAPWCQHCKAFHPVYEELAKKLKAKNPKLLLAKMDGTENEFEDIHLTGYPTLLFYPGNEKKEVPYLYKGDRTKEDLIKFIKEKSFNKFIYEEDGKTADL